MKHPYEDIIHLSRPVSRRAKMTSQNRAAQFAPFAALTGYDAAIRETARLTQSRRILDENEKAQLNARLCFLASLLEQKPRIQVTFFQPDERKDGGRYETFTGELRKIDSFHGWLCFADGTRIWIEDVCQIKNDDIDIL